ncbi:MAG: DUF362 domain-containing protein [Oscillospiraceae bacterium]|nr:DUF362 domain-containing protein [Oscillospiraceae bacterium]
MLVICYGGDMVNNTYDALAASDICKYLGRGFNVSLKPNLVVPGPASNGAVTHPEVTEGVIRFLLDFGVADIKIIESSWVGDSTLRAFKYCGYEELSRKYNIPLIDLKGDTYTLLTHGGYEIKVCDEALNTDFLINIPVLKAHCQTRLTCCLKNLKGCIPDSEKRRFHTLGIHKPVAALNALIKTGYCVVDGISGDLSFEEGGNPVTSNRIIAGRDPVMVDSFCAELIGYSPDEINYISYAMDYGVGRFFSPDMTVTVLGSENKALTSNPALHARAIPASQKYQNLIDEKAACSVCYSSLIYALHRMGGKFTGRGAAANGKLCIGQGFKGKTGAGIGIGSCTSGFERCIKGCPPKSTDIIKGLSRFEI